MPIEETFYIFKKKNSDSKDNETFYFYLHKRRKSYFHTFTSLKLFLKETKPMLSHRVLSDELKFILNLYGLLKRHGNCVWRVQFWSNRLIQLINLLISIF